MLRLAFPLGKVDFVSPLVKQRTDEGRPSETVVTSKSVALAAAPLAPSEGFGFRAPPVADAARRQAAAVRKCESEQPKHERLTAKGVEQHLTAALL